MSARQLKKSVKTTLSPFSLFSFNFLISNVFSKKKRREFDKINIVMDLKYALIIMIAIGVLYSFHCALFGTHFNKISGGLVL